MYMNVCIYIYICVCVCMYGCAHERTCSIHTHTGIWLYVFLHGYIYIYIYIYNIRPIWKHVIHTATAMKYLTKLFDKPFDEVFSTFAAAVAFIETRQHGNRDPACWEGRRRGLIRSCMLRRAQARPNQPRQKAPDQASYVEKKWLHHGHCGSEHCHCCDCEKVKALCLIFWICVCCARCTSMCMSNVFVTVYVWHASCFCVCLVISCPSPYVSYDLKTYNNSNEHWGCTRTHIR